MLHAGLLAGVPDPLASLLIGARELLDRDHPTGSPIFPRHDELFEELVDFLCSSANRFGM